MYCHNCGTKEEGEFCKNCGAKIIKSESLIIKSWYKENDFNKIVRHPDVLDLITKYSKKSKRKLTGEELINRFDLIAGPFTGVPFSLIAEIAVPIYKKIGIKTGKSDSIKLKKSIQEVFVKTMCSLSKNNYQLQEFHAAKDGVILISKLASDMWSWEGKILIELHNNGDFVTAKVQTIIKGQLYDWGKSKKAIETILTDLRTIELGE